MMDWRRDRRMNTTKCIFFSWSQTRTYHAYKCITHGYPWSVLVWLQVSSKLGMISVASSLQIFLSFWEPSVHPTFPTYMMGVRQVGLVEDSISWVHGQEKNVSAGHASGKSKYISWIWIAISILMSICTWSWRVTVVEIKHECFGWPGVIAASFPTYDQVSQESNVAGSLVQVTAILLEMTAKLLVNPAPSCHLSGVIIL